MASLAICLGFKDWHVNHLSRCLQSLRQNAAPVILVDLGSKASTLQHLRVMTRLMPWVTLLERPAAQWSRSLALNYAAAEAPAEVETLVFTDADMLFPASWFTALEATLAQSQGRDTLWLTDSRDLPQQWLTLLTTGYRDADLRGVSTPHDRVGQGAAMVVPRRWFETVGGFDETYQVWGCEDNDLVLRAQWSELPVEWLGPRLDAWVAHQWHRRDWPTVDDIAQVHRNRAYLTARIAERGPVTRNRTLAITIT